MINKKGTAQLMIGGISIGAIIYLIFQVWAGSLIISALEPEIDKALDSLEENIVCPPEFNSENYDICFNGKGEVIVNGDLSKSISIKTDAGDYCNINKGDYNHNIICTLSNINKASQIYVEGIEFQKKTIATTQIISYVNNLQNLKKPIKTGFWFFKKVKYIPI